MYHTKNTIKKSFNMYISCLHIQAHFRRKRSNPKTQKMAFRSHI